MATRAMDFGFVARWTPAMSLEAMDRNGIATAVTSISTVIVRAGCLLALLAVYVIVPETFVVAEYLLPVSTCVSIAFLNAFELSTSLWPTGHLPAEPKIRTCLPAISVRCETLIEGCAGVVNVT